ncbi:MAG: dTDP-4-dehydrorhamnose reductase [Phycisphaerales bacterium]
MKLLLLGADGQVGWELRQSLAPLGEVIVADRVCADFEQHDALRDLVRASGVDVVVNAAAYTAVDRAESESDLATRINADAPGVIAEECERLGALLVHYSTDYVFDGEKDAPYVETDAPNPRSVYGSTKLQGEQVIQASGCRHLIFRTSWVYSDRRNNFVRTILRLAQERESLSVVSDQIGAPTSAAMIADVTARCIEQAVNADRPSGLFHLTPTGETSWHGFASYFLDLARNGGMELKADELRAIRTDEFPCDAKRPMNSRLCCDRIRDVFGIELPEWWFHVRELIARMLQQENA